VNHAQDARATIKLTQDLKETDQMTRKKLIVVVPLLLLCFNSAAVAQDKLGHLRSWAGKYPTERKGKVTTSFFGLPEIRTPLLHLLSRADFNLLTKAYAVEAPIKQIGDYLAVKVCRPHNCGDEQGAFAINLSTGVIYVRMQNGEKVRWFASKGNSADLPQEVKAFLDDFSAT
jgi:hypothetical protein